jgi:N-acetylmuramoyl-L-alanine amidase-like
MPRDLTSSRRDALLLLAGGLCFAAAPFPAAAAETRVDPLIRAARQQGNLSQRIAYISRGLIGTRYRGYTLIGGPRKPEQFVVRDDGFDCVTYCETVLAAAYAGNADEFRSMLRTIRYHKGVVGWRERNHYFFEWGKNNVENKLCRTILLDGAVAMDKTVDWHKALGRRRFRMPVIPRASLFANKALLANGDIIAFVTRRPNLDYFHVGFIVFDDKGQMMLRHASQTHGRVLDERMDRFAAQNNVGYVTLWRPQEPHAVA